MNDEDYVARLRRVRPDLVGFQVEEFGFPGSQRDRLVAAILAGEKSATSSLHVQYDIEGSPLPGVGDRGIVIDSKDRPVAIIQTTRVELIRFEEVDLPIALAEGEGFTSVREWQTTHIDFWTSPEFRETIGDGTFVPAKDTPVVVTWFEVIERL